MANFMRASLRVASSQRPTARRQAHDPNTRLITLHNKFNTWVFAVLSRVARQSFQ